MEESFCCLSPSPFSQLVLSPLDWSAVEGDWD
jgi:hypothetical protein